MTDKTELLPLPEWMSSYTIPADSFECDKDVMLVDRMRDYARANVAVATAMLQAEIEALRAEAEQHLQQAMRNGAKARAAQAQANNLRTEVEALRAEVERLKNMTAMAMGVGSGDGNLFVHGDCESINAAQAIVLERDALRAEVERVTCELMDAITRAERLTEVLRLAEEHINDTTPEWYSAGQRVLAEIRTTLKQEEEK